MKNFFKLTVLMASLVAVTSAEAISCKSSVPSTRREVISNYIEQIELEEGRTFLSLDEVIELYKVKPSQKKEFIQRVMRESAQGIMWKENPRISTTGDSLNVAAFNLHTLDQLRLTYQFVLERE